MKKIIIIFLLLFTTFANASNQVGRLSKMKQAAFSPPHLKSVTLSNGMTCYLLEDHSMPLLNGMVIIKGGSIYEPSKKVGLSNVMMSLLKEGGTLKHKPDEIRNLLDENAIDIGFSSSRESFEGYFASLAKAEDKTLGLFFEMLFEPAFDEDALSVVKKRFVDSLKREKDVPDPISNRKFREMLYGEKSPWGDYPTPSIVNGISKKDAISFYERSVSPDRMILAISGDFDKKKMVEKLESFAKVYRKKELPELHMPEVKVEDSAETLVVSRKFTQSSINVGHLGSTRDNPDKYSIVIMNDILGGGGSFTNRLQNVVRVKNGLAYEVWSAYSFGPSSASGIFQIHAKTKNQTSKKAVELIKNEIQKLSDEGVTETEFKKAKDGILNKLVFEYERPFDFVSAVARFVYFGYPENYIEIYKKEIEKVSIGDVNAAAKKYLHPDALKIVVVGQYE